MRSEYHDKNDEGTKLSIAYSPCPNDTFMMDALIHHKIKSDIDYRSHLMDIQQLNENAMNGIYDITKISAATFPWVSDRYQLLDAGAAMGFGVGPILVSKYQYTDDEIKNLKVGIPGKNTTANKLFQHFYSPKEINYMVFSDIEQAILSDEIDAGVLIHEGRFTYQDKGLKLIQDLGKKWELNYQLPIPLGVLIVKKELSEIIKQEINYTINQSIKYAFDHPSASSSYVRTHAQELSDEVVKQHINLYVNKYSLSMGRDGHKALEFLLKTV